MGDTLVNPDVLLAEAHKMHNAWLALQDLAGTELALEVLSLLKPPPPPSPEFSRIMTKWIDKYRISKPAPLFTPEEIALIRNLATEPDQRWGTATDETL